MPSSPAEQQTSDVAVVLVAIRLDAQLEDKLARLLALDYPNLRFAVAVPAVSEAGGEATDDQFFGVHSARADRIKAVIPQATVCHYPPGASYGAAVNLALETLQAQGQPKFWLICNDSVELEADTVAALLAQLRQSKAALVAPKLMQSHDVERLASAGFTIDRVAGRVSQATPGELDQGQYDGQLQVFGVAADCFLIDSGLMAALGGFNTQIITEQDLDLCWRSNIAGGRVVLADQVRIKQRSLSHRLDQLDWLNRRHRLFSLLTCSPRAEVLVNFVLAVAAGVAESVAALLRGHPRVALSIVSAFWWNLRRLPTARRHRKLLKPVRYADYADVQLLCAPGLSSLKLRRRDSADSADPAPGKTRSLTVWLKDPKVRNSILIWLAIMVFFGFGSRHLLSQGIPQIGQFASFPDVPGELFSQLFSSLQTAGLGSDGFNSIALGVLGVLSTALLGAMGLARTVSVLLLIPIGVLGMRQLLRRRGGRSVAWIAAVVYLCLPLPYNALTNGSWNALLLYALLPWILKVALGDFDADLDADSDSDLEPTLIRPPAGFFANLRANFLARWQLTRAERREIWFHSAKLALLVALLAAFVPAGLGIVAGCIVVVAVGSLFAGVRCFRFVLAGLLGVVLAALLSLPQLPGYFTALFYSGDGLTVAADQTLGVRELLRFATGPFDNATLGIGLLVLAVLPVLVVRGIRFAWVTRAWLLICASVVLAWWAQRSGEVALSPDFLLVPAGMGFAIVAAMGVAALAADLPRYRLGWRQLIPLVGVVALVLLAVPLLVGSLNGRWDMSKHDYADSLANLSDDNYRVLWVGHPEVLPGRAEHLDDQTYYTLTSGVDSQLADLWSYRPFDQPMRDAIELVREGGSHRLGRLLAPMGIRFIVVVETRTPPPVTTLARPVEPWVERVLSQQLDMQQLSLREGITVYENVSSQPVVLSVPGGSLAETDDFRDATSTPFVNALAGASCSTGEELAPLGCEVSRGAVDGVIPDAADVYLASGSDNWRAEVGAGAAPQDTAFGWAQLFGNASNIQPSDGQPNLAETEVALSHQTPGGYRFVIVLQLVAWFGILLAVLLTRGSRSAGELARRSEMAVRT